MSKIKIFYREFFIILILLILFYGLFGTINDRFIQVISKSNPQELMAASLFHKLLFSGQALGMLGIIFIIYKNGLPIKRVGNKLTKKSFSTFLTISLVFIIIPYAVLLLT
ncbi:hypothetical protein [Robertmurraya massiliosenegalensis]|uniref:hypothetical protein n=1 Tax=Robertmurraya massiliosenegalensis TaxID=1287657 RepID=UPI00031BD152|nr:hypothetical protein [Robertmurraya massiliosenegalensis]